MSRAPQEGHLPKGVKPKPSFEDRWQAIKESHDPERVVAAQEEIIALWARTKESGIPYTETVITDSFVAGFGGSRDVIIIDLDDLPEGSLPPQIREPLLAHLANRRANPQLWGGGPYLALSFWKNRWLDGTLYGIDLTINTVNTQADSSWAYLHRQGIQAELDLGAVSFGDSPFTARTLTVGNPWPLPNQLADALVQLENYTQPYVTNPYKIMETLARFADGVVQARPPQPATAAA